MSALVKLIDVSKRYGHAAALHPTNLSIERGKTTVLIGPSGCGKSTLLRLIIRLIEPDSGRIDFAGEPISPDNIDSLNLLPRYPVELSGGQRQRVSLMRALMLSPELLLLDEPLGALDPLVRASLQNDLKEIFARLGHAVLFVTHDLAEAIYFGDEIVLMNEGRIVQKGTVSDLRERPADAFVSEFINAQRGIATV